MTEKWVNVEAIGSYFQSLSDPRHTRNRKHQLVDVIVIAVCGIICGCDGPTAIHRWASNRHEWLGEQSPRMARRVSAVAQRNTFSGLYSPLADRVAASSLSALLSATGK